MKKDFIKTTICVLVVMLILFFSVTIGGNVKSTVEMFTKTDLTLKDPTAKLLFDRIKGNDYLRKAKLVNTDLSSEDIVKFTIDQMDKDDYTVKTYRKEGINCVPARGLSFNVPFNKKCKFAIISNKKIQEMQQEQFNTNNKLTYDDLKYHDYYCKNSGSKYYCLMENNDDSKILSYSSFDSAYETKDKVIIREYYLRINANDKNRCSKFLSTKYCETKDEKYNVGLNDEVIKNNGVLFEYVFKKNGNKYYLEQSYIVSEG